MIGEKAYKKARCRKCCRKPIEFGEKRKDKK